MSKDNIANRKLATEEWKNARQKALDIVHKDVKKQMDEESFKGEIDKEWLGELCEKGILFESRPGRFKRLDISDGEEVIILE